MAGENEKAHGPDVAPGAVIAAQMLENLVRLNDNIQKSHEMYASLQESIDSLLDYHETYMRAAEILIEKHDEGKNKFTAKDFVQALAEAADEVMGEEEEDEPGEEDPLVPRRG